MKSVIAPTTAPHCAQLMALGYRMRRTVAERMRSMAVPMGAFGVEKCALTSLAAVRRQRRTLGAGRRWPKAWSLRVRVVCGMGWR